MKEVWLTLESAKDFTADYTWMFFIEMLALLGVPFAHLQI